MKITEELWINYVKIAEMIYPSIIFAFKWLLMHTMLISCLGSWTIFLRFHKRLVDNKVSKTV